MDRDAKLRLLAPLLNPWIRALSPLAPLCSAAWTAFVTLVDAIGVGGWLGGSRALYYHTHVHRLCHPPESWDGITTAFHRRSWQRVGEARRTTFWRGRFGVVRTTGWMCDASGVVHEDDSWSRAIVYEHSADGGMQVVVTDGQYPVWGPLGGRGDDPRPALQRVLYASLRFLPLQDDEEDPSGDLSRFINERIWSICGGESPGIPMDAFVASLAGRGLVRVPYDRHGELDVELTVLLENLTEARFSLSRGDVVTWPQVNDPGLRPRIGV